MACRHPHGCLIGLQVFFVEKLNVGMVVAIYMNWNQIKNKIIIRYLVSIDDCQLNPPNKERNGNLFKKKEWNET